MSKFRPVAAIARMVLALATLPALLLTGLLLAGAGVAHADGFFDGPTITCQTMSIDPASSWIQVTFDGNVNGIPFEVKAPYDGNVHLASADFSAETSSSGVLVISAVAHSDFGEGPVTSNIVTVTLTCHEPVPTSTSSTSTTTSAPTTTTTTSIAQTPMMDKQIPTVTTAETNPPLPALPRTGSSSAPLAAVGVLSLLAGAGGIMRTLRRRGSA